MLLNLRTHPQAYYANREIIVEKSIELVAASTRIKLKCLAISRS